LSRDDVAFAAMVEAGGIRSGLIEANEQYSAAVARCEATARDNGHTLDVWCHVSEELRASVCVFCGAMV
jgi:hypothetical protein